MAKTKPLYQGDWGSVDCTCDILDKQLSIRNYVQFMFDRTNQMFEYTGLPETIPAYILELFLQINGHVAIAEVEGKLYAFCGGLGGAPDPYYRQTLYVVANPALGISKSFAIKNYLSPFGEQRNDGDCVLIRNDTTMNGLSYLFSRYATQLAENDVSIRCAQINSRQQAMISGQSDKEIASAQKYVNDLVAGKLTVVAETAFFDGLKAANLSVQSSNAIIQLIELQQYLKASWYNEIGLNANFNMKREYLSEEEISSSTDVLLPLIDDMLACREEAISIVNSTFGQHITVKKNSAWDNKQTTLDTEKDKKEAEVEKLESDAEPEKEKEGDGE